MCLRSIVQVGVELRDRGGVIGAAVWEIGDHFASLATWVVNKLIIAYKRSISSIRACC